MPDALSVVLGTDLGAIVITGDYKFDHTPIDGRITDVNTFARLGEQGVLALLGDSTNAVNRGSTASESTVGQAFHQIFAEAEGRVIVACFASHIHRVQQAIKIAHLHGRKFAVSGRSMIKNVNIARNLGILKVPDGAMIKLTEIDDYRPEEILILTTGSQGEPLSALTRMAFDDHPQVELNEGDTVVISATPIPGNELSVMSTVNRLLKSGATVIHGRESGVHVSGHASQEDLRMMLNLVRPRYFLPVHGEYRHQHIHRGLARESGIPDEDIFILENGDVLEIDGDNAELVDKVPTGMVFVDGVRDRRRRGPRAPRPAAAGRRRHPHRRRHRRRPDRPDRRAAGARRPRLPARRRAPQGRARRVRRRLSTSSWPSSATSTSPGRSSSARTSTSGSPSWSSSAPSAGRSSCPSSSRSDGGDGAEPGRPRDSRPGVEQPPMATARPKQARRRTGAASRTRPRAGAAASKAKPKPPASRHRRELGAIACLAVAVFLAFVLYLGWDGGSLGRWLGDAARWLVGLLAFALPLLLGFAAYLLVVRRGEPAAPGHELGHRPDRRRRGARRRGRRLRRLQRRAPATRSSATRT